MLGIPLILGWFLGVGMTDVKLGNPQGQNGWHSGGGEETVSPFTPLALSLLSVILGSSALLLANVCLCVEFFSTVILYSKICDKNKAFAIKTKVGGRE